MPQLTGFNLNAKKVCPADTPAGAAPGGLVSPCPYVFVYDGPGVDGSWTGVLTLGSESELSGIYSRIIFDHAPLEVTVLNEILANLLLANSILFLPINLIKQFLIFRLISEMWFSVKQPNS